MKCRLCDRPTAGTVKLCVDCTKALMRARGASAASHKAIRPLSSRIEPTLTNPAAAPSPAWRPMAWAVAGLAAIGALYVSQIEPDRRPASVVGSTPLVERLRGEVPSMASPVDASSPTAEANAGAMTTTRVGATPKPAPAAGIDPAGNKSKASAAADREASHLLARAGDARTASSPEVDQVSASAPDKCGNEGPLTRFVCEQKVYLQYCENKWDKDPRCMRRTGSN